MHSSIGDFGTNKNKWLHQIDIKIFLYSKKTSGSYVLIVFKQRKSSLFWKGGGGGGNKTAEVKGSVKQEKMFHMKMEDVLALEVIKNAMPKHKATAM
ncbi:hypothetical protein ACJX0J_015205, partial [Zea mays]